MLPTDKFMLPRPEMLRFTSGSFEQISVRLEAALTEKAAENLGSTSFLTLGTFSDHITVLTDAGKVMQVDYKVIPATDATKLSIELGEATVVPAKVIPVQAKAAQVRKEAREIVQAFIKGDIQAMSKVPDLLQQMPDRPVLSESAHVDDLLQRAGRGSFWMDKLSDLSSLKTVLGEKFDAISRSAPAPKFQVLSTLTESGASAYAPLVNEGMNSLRVRHAALKGQVQVAVDKLTTLATTDHAPLINFVGSLIESMDEIPSCLFEADHSITSTKERARLYDGLARDFLRFELAGGFVSQTVNKLAAQASNPS